MANLIVNNSFITKILVFVATSDYAQNINNLRPVTVHDRHIMLNYYDHDEADMCKPSHKTENCMLEEDTEESEDSVIFKTQASQSENFISNSATDFLYPRLSLITKKRIRGGSLIMLNMKYITLIFVTIFRYNDVSSETLQSCNSMVYCQGELLDVVQKSGIFEDSKTFVDMTQINSSPTTLENFENLKRETNNNPTTEQIRKFLEDNFVSEGELENWSPADYNSDPAFLKKIDDTFVRDFAKSMVNIWPTLARKVKSDVSENPDRHSLIAVPHGFIIPGGRFKELYYWDSYWIIKGLLLSEMDKTVRGMLENLLSLVERYGFVPNGSRVYYLNRSQPPLLSLMVGLYIDAINDTQWLHKNIHTLEKELNWWLNNRTTVVEKDGVKYTLAHFASDSGTPRPESYIEDIRTCANYEDQNEMENCYKDLKGGAESGWDFSSRWIFDAKGGTSANLTYIQTRRVVPVDLNAYLCKAFEELSRFYLLLGNAEKSMEWKEKSTSWKKSIELVLYDKKDGIWYDYDISLSRPRKLFYPSNLTPLWTESYQKPVGKPYGSRAAKYLKELGIDDYRGGIPTSLQQSGEQWDFPNAWPPLQELVILGLMKSGDSEARQLAEKFARIWIDSNIRGYNQNKAMFEKYDSTKSGQYGGGGEYVVQTGFGWTNGVALSIINEFYVDDNNIFQKFYNRLTNFKTG
ncbi:hypothetical protein NQ314_020274 [Rhamnusium bicolor]|uniref:Trehalase n=1 Tax=Rhamnusium bicolor TaxID=1586634 RepID=A0AAV8WLD2_9CUCU|nr:hypothetical protein NQ314_020274 [Rhamnusium bicolor]